MRTGRSTPIFKNNHPDYSFYTSEHNDGHEDRFCRNGNYNPDEVRPPTGREIWRRWQFVYTGNARVPCWIVRVPEGDNLGSRRIMERQLRCHVGCSFSHSFPADSRRHGGSSTAASRSESSGRATIKSRQTALTGESPHHLTKQKKSYPSLGNENGAEGPEFSALGVRFAKLFRKSYANKFGK